MHHRIGDRATADSGYGNLGQAPTSARTLVVLSADRELHACELNVDAESTSQSVVPLTVVDCNPVRIKVLV